VQVFSLASFADYHRDRKLKHPAIRFPNPVNGVPILLHSVRLESVLRHRLARFNEFHSVAGRRGEGRLRKRAFLTCTRFRATLQENHQP
jgi:hypothetical protein